MKRFIFYTICLFLLACKNRLAEKPVWINAADTVLLPGAKFEFKTSSPVTKATLLTATQPIQLSTSFKNGKLVLQLLHKKGITEGRATICIAQGEEYFFYPLSILNDDSLVVITKEYRSPKTVNPDSGLQQQRIVHSFDVNRNILATQPRHSFFFEEKISLPAKAGVYQAVKNEALSSYYIQAGSCINIPLKAFYKKENNCYHIIAGPLKDKHHNTVADGTMVAFIYTDAIQTYRMEAALLNGYANTYIPAAPNRRYRLTAKVNETLSKQLNLQH